MASAKKAPGLLDQIGNLFGGKKAAPKSKGSFRGLSSSPARPAAAAPKKKAEENAVVTFFRNVGSQKSQSAKAKKASPTDGTGTLSKIFKM